MLHLDNFTMQDVEDDTEDLEDLDTGTIIGRLGEKWSQGTVGRIPSYNNWHGLSLNCAPGLM